jgi:two-component system, chemotaxis family, chemotaxis protein CheY
VSVSRKSPSLGTDLKEIRDAAAAARILVIEDDPDLGEVLCELLTIYGYRASCAADGIAALEILECGDLPELILLDLMLPRLDGWGFREAQLNDQRLKDIPVIVLSAVGEIVRPIDADHLLRKPVSPETLFASIERYRRRPSA